MRIAVVSDIHGNLTAFEAMLEDLEQMSPDLVLHGGDLADSGSSPIEIIDHIRDLGWQGVMGNTDEMLVRPASLEDFASSSSAPATLWSAVREIAAATRAVLGSERLAWLSDLPVMMRLSEIALLHASPGSCWRTPGVDATDEELGSIYGELGRPVVVFGHTHVPSIRNLAGQPRLLINSGSVGLPYDGDPRASYLLLDGSKPVIRRVEYDVENELTKLARCHLPGAEWTSKMVRLSSPQMP